MKNKITVKTVMMNLDAIITGITLTVCTIVVNLNVLMRYFFQKPLYWSEEIATCLFVWTVFIGSAYAYRKHAHLGVDILLNIMPEGLRKHVKMIMDIVELCILAMLTYVSVQYVVNTLDKVSEVLRMPSWCFSIAVPLGFGLSLIYSIYFLIGDAARAFKKGKESAA